MKYSIPLVVLALLATKVVSQQDVDIVHEPTEYGPHSPSHLRGTALRTSPIIIHPVIGDLVGGKNFVETLPVPMENVEFGIELELSTSSSVTTSDVANAILENATVVVLDMMGDRRGARKRNDVWRIMRDSSLVCPQEHGVDCNKFELVSPILRGEDGLGAVDRVVRALGNIHSLSVHQSMGFHVHVNVESLSFAKLKNVVTNFIVYESAMDMLMPPSRRMNFYCLSNKLAVANGVADLAASTRYLHKKIDACTSQKQLGDLVSPVKYFKLNMVPLTSNRQPTIEFRQHYSTYQLDEVKNWIQFCVAFVYNSSNHRPPAHLTKTYSDDELFDMMMMYIIKDRSLQDYYRGRKSDQQKAASNISNTDMVHYKSLVGKYPFLLRILKASAKSSNTEMAHYKKWVGKGSFLQLIQKLIHNVAAKSSNTEMVHYKKLVRKYPFFRWILKAATKSSNTEMAHDEKMVGKFPYLKLIHAVLDDVKNTNADGEKASNVWKLVAKTWMMKNLAPSANFHPDFEVSKKIDYKELIALFQSPTETLASE